MEGEPDVYVKTVLMFGNKPAPAMAQIALRKTTEENKDNFPEAADTTTKNCYIDDICDSVDDVESAKKITGNHLVERRFFSEGKDLKWRPCKRPQ